MARHARWPFAALSALGAALLLGGAALVLSQAQSEEVERVAALPRVSPAELAELPDGAEVLLQGRLRSPEGANEQGFVVYEEQQFLRREASGAGKGREEWGGSAVTRPRVWVEGAERRVQLCNEDYLLVRSPHRWQSEVVPRAGDLVRPATKRQKGFKAGDELTVDGRVSRATTPSCIRAKAVSGGDAEAYLEEQRGGVVALRVVGGIFGGLGALALAVGVSGYRRRRR